MLNKFVWTLYEPYFVETKGRYCLGGRTVPKIQLINSSLLIQSC